MKTIKQIETELEYIELCRKKLDTIVKNPDNTDIDLAASDNTRFTIPFTPDLKNLVEHILREEFQRVSEELAMARLRESFPDDGDWIKDMWRGMY